MRLNILHKITYDYSAPVFLEPHYLRLRPRTDPAQRVLWANLSITPEPAGISHGLDSDSNWLTTFWFGDTVEHLEVSAECEVETLRMNPFDFILSVPEFPASGSPYGGDLLRRLAAELTTGDTPATAEFARRAASFAPGSPLLDYLTSLNREIGQRLNVIHREKGPPLPPDETLRRGEGACRDLAMLFIEACRHVGIGARFVSGYQAPAAGLSDDTSQELHAWAEAYLPGVGWRGFDQTQGLMVVDGHVVIAASATPRGAAPIRGTFRGDGATQTMDAELVVKTL